MAPGDSGNSRERCIVVEDVERSGTGWLFTNRCGVFNNLTLIRLHQCEKAAHQSTRAELSVFNSHWVLALLPWLLSFLLQRQYTCRA